MCNVSHRTQKQQMNHDFSSFFALQPGAPHAGLKKVTDLLSKVRYKDTKVPIQGGFDPSCILPGKTDVFLMRIPLFS